MSGWWWREIGFHRFTGITPKRWCIGIHGRGEYRSLYLYLGSIGFLVDYDQ
jgi:hypothetical protein